MESRRVAAFPPQLGRLGSTDYRVHDRFRICEDWGRGAGLQPWLLTPAGRAGGNCVLSNCKVAIIASYRCEIGAPRAGPFVLKELAMPDLDLIKQAEQGCAMAQAVLRVKMANDTPTLPSPARGGGLGRGSPPISTARHRSHLARRRGARIRHRRHQRGHHLAEVPLARSPPSAA